MLKYGTLLCVLLISPQLYSADPVWIKNDGHGGPVDVVLSEGQTEVHFEKEPPRSAFNFFIKSVNPDPPVPEVKPGQFIRLWDPQKETVLQHFSYHHTAQPVLFSPQSDRFLTRESKGVASISYTLRDASTGELIQQYPLEFAHVGFFNNGEHFFIVSIFNDKNQPEFNVYNSENGELQQSKDAPISDFSISSNGKRYLAAERELIENSYFIWETFTGEKLLRLDKSKNELRGFRALDWSSNDDFILANLKWHTIGIWNADTGKQLHTIKLKQSIYAGIFSPDGSKILLGSGTPSKIRRRNPTGRVTLIETQSGRIMNEFKTQEDYVKHVSFSYDGRYAFASGTAVRGLYVWEISK